MFAGSLTATYTRTTIAYNNDENTFKQCYKLIAFTIFTSTSQLYVKTYPIADILSGIAFSGALTISGMVKPSKVFSFLDFANDVTGFDPSLGLVMGGALLVSLPSFQWLGLSEKPGIKEWKNRPIDWKTFVGGILFGAGWGLGGICPGPGLTTAGMSLGGMVWVAAMFGARGALGMVQQKGKQD